MRYARMMGMVIVGVLAGVAGCGADEEAVPISADPQGDTIAMGEELYSESMFDTIAWVADSAAISRGAVVWTFSCQKCHGAQARGDGGFVQRGDTLRPPSFLDADWRFADDRAAMRHFVFVGGRDGMPHWGIAGLKPRDIDAVTMYIDRVLRAPEGRRN